MFDIVRLACHDKGTLFLNLVFFFHIRLLTVLLTFSLKAKIGISGVYDIFCVLSKKYHLCNIYTFNDTIVYHINIYERSDMLLFFMQSLFFFLYPYLFVMYLIHISMLNLKFWKNIHMVLQRQNAKMKFSCDVGRIVTLKLKNNNDIKFAKHTFCNELLLTHRIITCFKTMYLYYRRTESNLVAGMKYNR